MGMQTHISRALPGSVPLPSRSPPTVYFFQQKPASLVLDLRLVVRKKDYIHVQYVVVMVLNEPRRAENETALDGPGLIKRKKELLLSFMMSSLVSSYT
jgi:hypothetical protein